MEIAFHSRSLRDTCESENMLVRQFGDRVGESIKRRLADLRAATSITDIVVGCPRELPTPVHPTICIDLPDGFRILLRSNHVKPPLHPDGRIDWSTVSRIKLMSIEKCDG
jgi:hypothetical protein